MPNMDGPTATREIRASGYTAPIFGVTGNGLSTDIEYFMAWRVRCTVGYSATYLLEIRKTVRSEFVV